MIKNYSLRDLESLINVHPLIDKNSEITLNSQSLRALQSKSLRLNLKVQKASMVNFKCSLTFFAISGDFTLRYWPGESSINIGEITGVWDISIGDSLLDIGDGTTSNGTRIVLKNSELKIGKDCMFSDGILLQCTDQHGIVDVKTKTIVNSNKKQSQIGNHVWLGRNSAITPGVSIGEGAIVGLGSVVTRNVPTKTVVAGNPAKIIKESITWTRDTNRLDNYCINLPEENSG